MSYDTSRTRVPSAGIKSAFRLVTVSVLLRTSIMADLDAEEDEKACAMRFKTSFYCGLTPCLLCGSIKVKYFLSCVPICKEVHYSLTIE